MSVFTDPKLAEKIGDHALDLAGIAGAKAAEVIFNKVRMWGGNEDRTTELFNQAGEAFDAVFADRGYAPDIVDALADAAMETCISHFNRLELEAEIVRRL